MATRDLPSSFAGSAFDPALPDGRASGSLAPEATGLRFESGERRIDLAWDGLRLRLGGANHRLVFFEHPARPDTSLFTADHRILEHPAVTARPELAAAVQGVRRAKSRRLATVGAVLGLLAAIVAALVGLKDPLVGLVVARIPPSLEIRLGEVVFSQIRLSNPLVEDPALDAELTALAKPLLDAVPDAGYPFRLHLGDSAEVNAFAIPGGHVVVNSGLILEAEAADEVLGVLAHEIAHVTRRHSLRQLVSSAGVFLLVQTFLGDLSGLMAVAVDGGARLLTLRFSRDFEREADDGGWDTLLAAGVDPRGLARFFEKLQASQPEGAALEGSLAFLSTHPSSAERIARLAERGAALERTFEPATSAESFAALQDRIRARTSRDEASAAPAGASAAESP